MLPPPRRRCRGSHTGEDLHKNHPGRKRYISPTLSISTVSLQSQLILQSWHDFTRSVMVQPGCLVPTKPAGAPATALCRMVDAEVLLDRSRDQLLQSGVRQRGGPDFFPAAPPDSGTTRPTATGSGGGARRSSSAPGNRP